MLHSGLDVFCFFKQKTAYELRISDWSSDVCSSDLINVPPGPLAQFDPANFRRLVEVNIVGAFNILQEAARQVAEGGSIIALTTSLVRFAAPGLGPYSGTKAAVGCLVRSLATEPGIGRASCRERVCQYV